MNFFKKRKVIKEGKHCLHEARHFRRMKEDIADVALISNIKAMERDLARAVRRRRHDEVVELSNKISAQVHDLVGEQKYSFIREHLEIAVVALSIAMAVRAYFFQPFKIPTGSMQPTLYGITVEDQSEPRIFDRFPFSWIIGAYTGAFYREVRATSSGYPSFVGHDKFFKYYDIGGVRHKVRLDMDVNFGPNQLVRSGDIIASGRFAFGDHIFVDRVTYNFRSPRRGEIFVFRTDSIDHPDITENTFYIKRMMGLPGETIEINNQNQLVIDGLPLENLHSRRWTEEERAMLLPNGSPVYIDGFIHARSGAALSRPGDSIELADDEYLPLGDNTQSSLDGRYFGGVKRDDIVGPAFMVYWPFSQRWGPIRR